MQNFINEDSDVQDVEIPKYTGSTYLKGKKCSLNEDGFIIM